VKKKILFTAIIIITILPAFLSMNACNCTLFLEESYQYEYAIDNLPGSVDFTYKLNEGKLARLVDGIKKGDFGKINSLIIIHNDSLASEEYFRGWSRHMRHKCASVTKSFTSVLIGIAIDQGKIGGMDEKLLSSFPRYDDIANLDERKESITLRHILTMTSGFKWDPDPRKEPALPPSP
jgi:CubicO group peptidase (beta-lactamase class C family)